MKSVLTFFVNFAVVLCTVAVVYLLSYAWVTSVADEIIKKYYQHRQSFRISMDKTIQELLKDYPQA